MCAEFFTKREGVFCVFFFFWKGVYNFEYIVKVSGMLK